jgi:hypothetical protein
MDGLITEQEKTMSKPKQTYLFVKAVPKANVHVVGATNQGQVQFIGKVFNKETKEFDIVEEGMRLPFHPEYIKHLKDGSLLPLNEETAVKAGVTLNLNQ